MPNRLTTDEFVERAQKIHGGLYDYSKIEYKNNIIKINILCEKHGNFKQRPADHLVGKGCQKCAKRQVPTNSEWIEKARAVHGNKYDYSKVTYINNRTKIAIICPEHGVFYQTPNKHSDEGTGCKKCADQNTGDNLRHTKNKFIEKAVTIHGLRYNYEKVNYVRTHDAVIINCRIHGDFKQLPSNHLRGVGCPACAKNGYKAYKIGYLYLLKTVNSDLLKVGITNNPDTRHAALRCKTPFEFEVAHCIKMNGAFAQAAELKIKKSGKNAGLSGFDGATEWFIYSPRWAAVIEQVLGVKI